MDGYLKLTAKEMQQYERAIEKFTPTERKETMEITTSWELTGIMQGKETLVARQLRRRLGTVPAALAAHLDTLTPDQLDDLGEALLDFTTPAALEDWLTQHQK